MSKTQAARNLAITGAELGTATECADWPDELKRLWVALSTARRAYEATEDLGLDFGYGDYRTGYGALADAAWAHWLTMEALMAPQVACLREQYENSQIPLPGFSADELDEPRDGINDLLRRHVWGGDE